MSAGEINHIVVLGAGQAGAQAVATLRENGFGGALTLVGDEPHLPYQRPPLSKAYLQGKLQLERLLLRPQTYYQQHDCKVILGLAATSIDRGARTVTLADGRTLIYDRLLLATGTSARRLRVPGAHLEGVHYLRNISDTDALRTALARSKRVAIIGGGYIGLQVAAVAAAAGLDVTVFEAMSRPMARVASAAIAEFLATVHRSSGVTFALSTTVEKLAGNDRLTGVRAGGQLYPADSALVGIGVVPNDTLAREAGLATHDGIVVDEYTRTNDPLIFAAGDCTRHPSAQGGIHRLECVQNAVDQARHAALAMLDQPKAYREIPWFWSDQFEIKLQMAGVPRPDDQLVVRGDRVSRKFAVFHLRDAVVSAVEAVNSAPEYMAGRRMIASGVGVETARLADSSIPIKSML